MAVEARHLNLFSPQFLHTNRDIMNGIDGNLSSIYSSTLMGYGGGLMPPLSGTTTETFLPVYGSAVAADSVPTKPPPPPHPSLKTEDSSFKNYSPLPLSRKRNRDSIDQQFQSTHHHQNDSFSFLGEDITLQIQYQQLEIDNFIAQQTEKVRLEIEERRKRNSRRIIAAVEEGIVKKLRTKEEQLDKMGKLNWALEEKVKSLCMENQIWRDLAQTNEATANALRTNLEQVLTHVHDNHRHRGVAADAAAPADLADDAESCCGSNFDGDDGGDECGSAMKKSDRLCRKCGKVEACVLLLPCRHLCLCAVCGSSMHTCPVCKSTKNASVHVNMSCN